MLGPGPGPVQQADYILDNSYTGENCSIAKNCYLYNSYIGDYTYLSTNVCAMNSKIGKFCSIGQGACISLGMHPTSTFVTTHPSFFSPFKKNGMTFADKNYFAEMGSTTIGNDVWIGVNAVIMDNITIGNGAIIGAGAVVTKNVPPYAIAVGIPARVVKYRFEKEEIGFLEGFKWWDKKPNWLQENFKDLHDIKQFIKKHGDH